jgi:DNA-binding HxlR family transcriptional regulator
MADNDEEPLKQLFSKGTREILEYAVEKGAARNKEFQQFGSQHTVNTRLKYLYHHGLLQHRFTKEDVRTEWYEATEKGRNALRLMHCIYGYVLEDLPCSCIVE